MTSTIDALNKIMNGLAPTNPTKPVPVPEVEDPTILTEAAAKKEELIAKLRHGAWMVEFTKVDGTPSVMECTLDDRFLPPPDANPQRKANNPTLIHVYAIDRGGWRSMKVLNVSKVYRKAENL